MTDFLLSVELFLFKKACEHWIFLRFVTEPLIPLSTDGLLPPVPVCGHHCSVRGGCDGAAARHRPNVAPLQQPLHAHEWRAGATQGIAGNSSGVFLLFMTRSDI